MNQVTVKPKNDFFAALLSQFEQQELIFAADWLQELRHNAALDLVQAATPSKNDEDWRFTDLSELLQYHLTLAQKVTETPDISAFILPETIKTQVVFVNGYYAADLSDVSGLPQGIYVGNLSDMPPGQKEEVSHLLAAETDIKEVFTTLNTSGLNDIAVIWVGADVIVESPIHLLFLSVPGTSPLFSQPRVLVVAQKSSNVSVIEYYGAVTEKCSDEKQSNVYLTNAVTQVYLEENAQVTHSRIQRESGDAFHIANTVISQARDSRYTFYEICFGAKLSRHNLTLLQTGEQTESNIYGLTMIGRSQLADTHSVISLTKAHGTTNQLHKCIVDDRSAAVFNGKVIVPKTAQFTNASQLNRNLLLSSQGRVNTKPELQITADNVKCSHGATVSQLEDEEIFYLRSRGLNETDARHLLIDAFAAEILHLLPLESLQTKLTQCVVCKTPY